jgi:hypothetical protein
MQDETQVRETAATVSGIIGIVLYVAVGFVYLTSGLVVPYPWLLVLWAVWAAGIYALVTVFRARRVWTPAVPLAAALFWWVFLTVGENMLGWTA